MCVPIGSSNSSGSPGGLDGSKTPSSSSGDASAMGFATVVVGSTVVCGSGGSADAGAALVGGLVTLFSITVGTLGRLSQCAYESGLVIAP